MARPRQTILVLDDDKATREGLGALLEGWGYAARSAGDGEAALRICEKELPDAVISDLMMPGLSGIDFLRALGEQVKRLAVIMLTGQATIETAVEAIKLGAFDYLTKPLDPQRLRTVLENALKQVALVRETDVLRRKLESPLGSYGALIGKSPAMRELYQRIGQIAPTDAAVLIHGESGTGKELVARTLHDLSPRREGVFLAINCAAISPTLMESELFGHEKGAFTNALERRAGCFEQADGGTLFLDEITEMAAEVQPKFLRVLEEGRVRRIGGSASVAVSVRVIAATNRNPAAAVKERKLRQDLFYRLSVFNLELPPLRDRGEDIGLLAGYFLETFGNKYHRPALTWSADFLPALQAYPWPGNVRELRNSMERLAVLSPGPELKADDLKRFCFTSVLQEPTHSEPLSLAEAERQAIERALAATSGNKTQAARILGITPKTLNAKLALYRPE